MIFTRAALGALPVGRATVKDVEALFGGSHTRANARMVLCGTTRFRSIIRSSLGAVAVEMRTLNDHAEYPLNRSMRAAIFLAILLCASVSAIASPSTIISPDHHQTFAYGEMLSHQLYPRTRARRTGGPDHL